MLVDLSSSFRDTQQDMATSVARQQLLGLSNSYCDTQQDMALSVARQQLLPIKMIGHEVSF